MAALPYLYILCGKAHEASSWAREMDIPISRVRIVTDEYQLRGIRDPHYVVIGSFWQRPDADRIWEVLQHCMMIQQPLWPSATVQTWIAKAVIKAMKEHGRISPSHEPDPDVVAEITRQVNERHHKQFKKIQV